MDVHEPDANREHRPDGDVWSELGQQFQSLGESLAQAVRKTWESAESQRKMDEMRNGLEHMIHQIDNAIRDTAASAEGQRVREEAGKTAQSLRDAGEQAVQEARPHLVKALEALNQELQALTRRIDKSGSGDAGSSET